MKVVVCIRIRRQPRSTRLPNTTLCRSGEFGVYLDSKGDKSPYRMKMRPMGLTLTGALDPMLRGQKIADLITTGAAIDFVIPDIDR